MSEQFCDAIRRAMEPLRQRVSLREVLFLEEAHFCRVAFSNEHIGLDVAIDWMEFRPFIRVVRLKDGTLPALDEALELERPIGSFDVDDLLLLRSVSSAPMGHMLAERSTPAVEQMLSGYVRLLIEHIVDVLLGNLSEWPQLDAMVRRRAEQARGISGGSEVGGSN